MPPPSRSSPACLSWSRPPARPTSRASLRSARPPRPRRPAGHGDRLATPDGRAPYRQRSALVEPGFAQLFQRFGRRLDNRGHRAVDAEIKLLGTVHNLSKLITSTTRFRF
ncbi:transposase [Streptomyces sp. NPDC054813]